ncbi:MAG: 50S ribosomal protein L22 [Bacilli bacterium]|jgi:large subunit ribosomal protein L22|nr:50S ribosomal protein L22 [Bacilli bacterium]
MKTYAIHKSAMIAPRKARMTLDLIRGKDVSTAAAILDTTNTKASRLIQKVLKSAIANAVNNNGAQETELFISTCYINPGPVYKRIKFASRGNVDRRDKRTSHIYVEVSDGKSEGGNE